MSAKDAAATLDCTYRGELGPVIEIPMTLRIPKRLYEIWQEICSQHRGWFPEDAKSWSFEQDVNYLVLQMYGNYLNASYIAIHETIGKTTADNLKAKYRIDDGYLEKIDSAHDYLYGILEAKPSG